MTISQAISYKKVDDELTQGDIVSHVEYYKKASIENGILEIEKILFPKVYILTQSCDLAQNIENKKKLEDSDSDHPYNKIDKCLISILVAPLYNADLLRNGTHMQKVYDEGKKAEVWTSDPWGLIKKNHHSRFHFLKSCPEIDLVDSVIDFKHYFSVDFEQLCHKANMKPAYSVSVPYREDISQRFAAYLSRIGLP